MNPVIGGKTRLAVRESELCRELAAEKDPQTRFSRVIERARMQPPLPDEFRQAVYLVPGCQVRLWWVPSFANGTCWFQSDSDAVTLKAMTRLLAELYSGATPAEILAHPADLLDRYGLLNSLAENRRATVVRVMNQIQSFAKDWAAALPAPKPDSDL